MARAEAYEIDVNTLPLTHLAQFVGLAGSRHVATAMRDAGFGDLRESHGFLIQHLLRGPHSVGELSRLLGVTQQAVSKSVAELSRAGYLEAAPSADARVRIVQLSPRGHESVLAARKLRERLERKLQKSLGARYALAQRALAEALTALGGVDAVRGRRVPPPR